MMIATSGDIFTWVAWSAVIPVGVVLAGLFCGLETGIYVLNKFRLDLRAESGSRAAGLLKRMIGNYNNLLAVLLIGTNLAAYFTTFAISAIFVLSGLGQHVEWYTVAVATPILFIFGESVPKNVFQRLAERLVYRLSWVLGFSSMLFNACGVLPLVRGFTWLMMRLVPPGRRKSIRARHEGIAAIVAEGRACGVLTHFQSVMADRVMHISHVRLSDVMVPLGEAVSAPLEVGRGDLLELIRSHNYSRLPLLDDDGQVSGILDIYEVLLGEGEARPADFARPPHVMLGDIPVTDALYLMQRAGATLAVVKNADNQHMGIVTVKDLVEEIVGELEAW